MNSTLIASPLTFYSRKDEDAFFAWLKSIEYVLNVVGKGRELIIELKSSTIPDNDLRDLLAIFNRYDFDMKQLQQFLTDENK